MADPVTLPDGRLRAAGRISAETIKRKKGAMAVYHCWLRDKVKGEGVYRCSYCGEWTANVPLYFNDVCPAKERRKGDRRRSHDQ